MARWQRRQERSGNAPSTDLPFVLSRDGHHGPVVHAANRVARRAGVTTGSRIVDMRAVCPELKVEYADIGGDVAALEQLVLWVRRWCPWSVSDGADGIVLDTTGSDHLFGGEAEMLADMEAQLSSLGLDAQLAVAPTWGAAWALARYGPVRSVCLHCEMADQLKSLSVAALRLDGAALLALQRLGLKTIGTLMEVPRLSLTRRFAQKDLKSNPLMRLDQAMGRLAEPVSSVEARPPVVAQARLPEPIFDPTAYLPELTRDLAGQLAAFGLGCRRLVLTVYRTDGKVSFIEVATAAPSRDPEHLAGLFKDRLARIDPGFGFDLITLSARAVETIALVQTRFDGAAEDAVALSRLVDRLVARFGDRAVQVPQLYESYIPERTQSWQSALGGGAMVAGFALRERPIRLLSPAEEVRVLYAVPEGPPVQFMWRKQAYRVSRYAGPERIAPEWWKDRPTARLRDYFKVETSGGLRCWIYREGMHGDGRGGDPCWYVHGLFG